MNSKLQEVDSKIIWHTVSAEEVIKHFHSDSSIGLSLDQVRINQEKFGRNKLPQEKPLSQLRIFFEQFKNSLIYILMFAGIVTLLLKEYTDSIVIFVAVFLNTFVGYIQESKSSKALRKLKNVLSINAIVLRANREIEILADELVPGDIVLLKPGNKVPADGRLIEVDNLKVNESALTGEWLPASKNNKILKDNTPLADRDNMVYMGTVVEDGRAKFIVTSIGLKTEIGRITSLVKGTKEDKTPYQKKLAHFSRILGIVIALICFAIFIQGIIVGRGFFEMFITAVAVVVASIPEGLPVSMTVILALGMQKIFKKKGLVRKLSAAETLGSTSIIATDKTGTLTKAKMSVAGVYTYPDENLEDKSLVVKIAILCSESFIENPDAKPENWKIIGMSTEKPIILEGSKYGFVKNQLENLEPQIDQVPFSSEYKYSATLRKSAINSKENIIYAKGAPEVILKKSKYLHSKNQRIEINREIKSALMEKYEQLTTDGYRVLGVAYKNIENQKINLKESINDLIFAGFIFLEDPIRKSAKQAIQTCYQAGMRTIIITGDHKLTAKSVANKLGLKIEDKNILEASDLEKMSDEEFKSRFRDIDIYARVEPRHKLRIIKAWQDAGEVVAMTGDGINDAPALKQANIGVALGSGTEVAKEVSDIVLLTDDFSVIVSAVEEGRAILDNIRKVITYLLSDSFTEIVLIGVSIMLGFPLPITAVQILWINLIEDGLPNIALAFEPKEKDLMKQKPQGKNISLLTREMKIIIFVVGLITDIVLLGLFFWLWKNNHNINYVRTMVFASLAIDSICYVFCCKSLRKNLWNINFFDNKFLIGAWFLSVVGLLSAIYLPFLNRLLGTVAISLSSWLIIGGLALINVVLIEVVKYYFIVKHKTNI
ncbi:MAG TPA: HAD-IC family P-type ATPase [bacterium]|jgi:Ca2+-transporting ATPase|nr:HAD-IC family P-type ATPase [bacterium]HOG38478.1 HAD-IC family P-type ATPase [bacterium]HQI03535.1 HAD-IC family P-type ATPase [bacterium]